MRSSWVLAVLLLTAAPTHAAELDAIVAAIGYQPIARSTLDAYRAAFEPGAAPGAALQHLIDDRLLAGEARRYGLTTPARELEAARQAHPAPPGFTANEWDRVLRDRALATRLLEFRFGDFVPVDRAEVRALIAQEPGAFKGDMAAKEAQARERLTPIVRARRQAAFLQELRERGEVRWVGDVPKSE